MRIIKLLDPRLIKTHGINYQKAYGYAKAMERGDIFPPIRAFKNEEGQWICQNGAHRIHACKMLGMKVKVWTKGKAQ